MSFESIQSLSSLSQCPDPRVGEPAKATDESSLLSSARAMYGTEKDSLHVDESSAFNERLLPSYTELERCWRNPLSTDSQFKAEYETAYKRGEVPITYDDFQKGVKEVGPISTAKMQPLETHILTRMNECKELARSAEPTSPLLLELKEDFVRCLQFLAHVEADNEYSDWEELFKSAHGSNLFNSSELWDTKTQLQDIKEKQQEQNKKENPCTVIGGSGYIPMEIDSNYKPVFTEQLKDIGSKSLDQESVLSSLKQFSSLPTKLEPCEVPNLDPLVEYYIKESCIDSFYKMGGSLKDFELFTKDFKRYGSFKSQVKHLCGMESASPEDAERLFCLHVAVKVLLRDIPRKDEFQDFSEVNEETAIAEAKKVVEMGGGSASYVASVTNYYQQVQLMKLALPYFKSLLSAIESKAFELQIELYMDEL
ncbi:hypothetical protein D5R81_19000 [Parashewanella spongiae]|uniref:Uncharacterized protein n=1 Tax=Parashewanella spongiae TaxID=342950 RepID=A0A3A6TJF3_9GAMM|nr:hypothetical protein [Parashewanella spongiae]MCL1080113.1 hypothetical protein [Parashewanella spongiae]RJY04918.1 hypothetical protein D5R81_19000 [Parashewanella spongiae]